MEVLDHPLQAGIKVQQYLEGMSKKEGQCEYAQFTSMMIFSFTAVFKNLSIYLPF